METIHTVYVSAKKPCLYASMERNGFPELGTFNLLPGENISDKMSKWLNKNWMIRADVMQLIVELINICEDKDKMSWSVRNTQALVAVKAFFAFMKSEYATLKHLGTAFNMPNPEDIKPFVSPELLAMSFAERQEILRLNNEARLEEVKE